MPRYFFHVHDIEPSVDRQGEDLPDDEAAWREATIFTGQLFKDIDGRFRPGQQWNLEVADQDGRTLYRIFIGSEAVR